MSEPNNPTEEQMLLHSELTYPITVTAITVDPRMTAYRERPLFGGKCGDFVSVRPVGEVYGGKTYLGVLIGEIANTPAALFDKATGVLTVMAGLPNPAIFVPDLGKVIFGYESWWGRIADESQLREITDNDIQNVWYMKALKQLSERDTNA